MVTERYVERAYCPTCLDYIWTNVNSPSIICLDGGAHIENQSILTGEAVTDEAIFKTSVAAHLMVNESDLVIEKV